MLEDAARSFPEAICLGELGPEFSVDYFEPNKEREDLPAVRDCEGSSLGIGAVKRLEDPRKAPIL